ncbi:hypothetical protein [Streptococcus bovimastitidis]
MKPICKNQMVEVWQMSKEGIQPDWVKSAFEKNIFNGLITMFGY